MPALSNPRWERFALALYAGLAGETRLDRAQSTAYRTAYPNCSEGNSAEAAASRLLRRVKPISDRVRELQQEAAARLQPKLDVSRERIGRRLDKASHIAERRIMQAQWFLLSLASLRSSAISSRNMRM
jgi:hypothetical protein